VRSEVTAVTGSGRIQFDHAVPTTNPAYLPLVLAGLAGARDGLSICGKHTEGMLSAKVGRVDKGLEGMKRPT
jgi:hypothetical protein